MRIGVYQNIKVMVVYFRKSIISNELKGNKPEDGQSFLNF